MNERDVKQPWRWPDNLKPEPRLKVIRVLEYEGTESRLEKQFERSGVKRIYETHPNSSYPDKLTIRELVLGRETPLGQRLKIAWRIVFGKYDDLDENVLA